MLFDERRALPWAIAAHQAFFVQVGDEVLDVRKLQPDSRHNLQHLFTKLFQTAFTVQQIQNVKLLLLEPEVFQPGRIFNDPIANSEVINSFDDQISSNSQRDSPLGRGNHFGCLLRNHRITGTSVRVGESGV